MLIEKKQDSENRFLMSAKKRKDGSWNFTIRGSFMMLSRWYPGRKWSIISEVPENIVSELSTVKSWGIEMSTELRDFLEKIWKKGSEMFEMNIVPLPSCISPWKNKTA